MQRVLSCVLALPCFAMTPACDAPDDAPEAADARDDAFISGKADGGLTPAELAGVLAVVNTQDFETLDVRAADGGVGLDRRAAEGIIAVRAGDDETLGTEDDGSFETLAQVDAVPYVGPVALDRLLDFAYVEGFVAAAEEGPALDPVLGSYSLISPGRATYRYEHWTGPESGATGSTELSWHAEVEVFEDDEGQPRAGVRCWVTRDESESSYVYDEVSGVGTLSREDGSWTTQVESCETNPYDSPSNHCARCTLSFEMDAEGSPIMNADFEKDSFTNGAGVSWQPTVYRSYSFRSQYGLRQ